MARTYRTVKLDGVTWSTRECTKCGEVQLWHGGQSRHDSGGWFHWKGPARPACRHRWR